jgi:hypothetical protein
VDAATAVLLGASLGLTGTLVAPIVTSYQAGRAKSQELMRDAYARGFACLARIPRCDTPEDHRKLRDKMLEALTRIEIAGVKTTSDLYGTVVESYEAWKIQGGANTAFEVSAKKSHFGHSGPRRARVRRGRRGDDRRGLDHRVGEPRRLGVLDPIPVCGR